MHIKSRHIDWQFFEMDNSWCSKPITSATLFSRCHKRTTAELSPIDFTWQKTWNRLRASKPGFKPRRCDNKNQLMAKQWITSHHPLLTACFLIDFHVDSSVLGQQKWWANISGALMFIAFWKGKTASTFDHLRFGLSKHHWNHHL